MSDPDDVGFDPNAPEDDALSQLGRAVNRSRYSTHKYRQKGRGSRFFRRLILLAIIITGIYFVVEYRSRWNQFVPARSVLSSVLGPDAAAGEELRRNNVGLVVVMVTYAASSDQNTITLDIPVATGSAFAIDPDGILVTNAHVANAGGQVHVPSTLQLDELSSETFYRKPEPNLLVCFGPSSKDQFVAKATVIDDQTDLAFLQIDHSFTHPLRLASGDVHQGVRVAACGFPGVVADTINASSTLSQIQIDAMIHKYKTTNHLSLLDSENASIFSNILTEGTVGSAHTELDGKSYIEFSAKVAHGNSGGPLLNSDNEAIGVVSLKMENDGNAEYEGYNFAIPITVVQDQLETFKKMRDFPR